MMFHMAFLYSVLTRPRYKSFLVFQFSQNPKSRQPFMTTDKSKATSQKTALCLFLSFEKCEERCHQYFQKWLKGSANCCYALGEMALLVKNSLYSLFVF